MNQGLFCLDCYMPAIASSAEVLTPPGQKGQLRLMVFPRWGGAKTRLCASSSKERVGVFNSGAFLFFLGKLGKVCEG